MVEPAIISGMSDTNPRSRMALVGWLAAGVSAVVAALAVVYAMNVRNQMNDVELRLVDAVTKMQAMQDQLVAAAGHSDAMRTNLALLSAADLSEAVLVGKALAPDATGRVYVSRSKGLLISASKLPPTLAGRTYQLWWQTPKGAVSVGVFSAAQDGTATAVFDLPEGAPATSSFTVTDESEGGAQAPSSTVVMATR